jgi:hypothetical protein
MDSFSMTGYLIQKRLLSMIMIRSHDYVRAEIIWREWSGQVLLRFDGMLSP